MFQDRINFSSFYKNIKIVLQLEILLKIYIILLKTNKHSGINNTELLKSKFLNQKNMNARLIVISFIILIMKSLYNNISYNYYSLVIA